MPAAVTALLAGRRRDVIERLLRRRRDRIEWAKTLPAWQPGQRFVDVAPRPTPRQDAFDFGDEPLPGFSWPPPRRTPWAPR